MRMAPAPSKRLVYWQLSACAILRAAGSAHMKLAVRYARYTGIAALFIAAALLGTLSGVLFAYSDDLPEVSALDNYTPNTITRVLGKNGDVVGEFAVERRVVV